MERNSQPRLAKSLHSVCFTEDARSRWDNHVLAAVRIHSIGDEAVDGCLTAAIQPVRQDGVDNGAFHDAVKRTGRTDCVRLDGRATSLPQRWRRANGTAD